MMREAGLGRELGASPVQPQQRLVEQELARQTAQAFR